MSSGLATKIASSSTSSTFDLCHLSSSTITAIVSTAFSKPLPITDMIRLTFIVGGGKATRGKYDEGALTAVVGALRGCGYREERGGGCVLECAGSYKVQHDTGKNLRTVVVFPLIRGGEEDVDEEEEEEEVADEEGLIPAGSVGYKIAVCPMASFISLLSLHCPTYLQKKQCLRTLSGLIELQSAIEHKMMNGQRLDASEKSFYDSSIELSDKMEHVQKEATKHIEEGNLTYEERKILIEMNEKRIQSLMNEENSASVADQLKKALARKELLNRNTGEATLPPLRLESQINTLRKKLIPLKALEEESHQRFLSYIRDQGFIRKGRFGTRDREIRIRVPGMASRDQFEAKHAKNARGGKASVGGGGSARSLMSSVSGSTKWILPDSNKLKGNKNAWGSTATKRRNNGGGAVFSAMMMDSSSEEETDDDDKRSDSFVRTVSVPKLIPERQSNLMKSPKSMPNIKSVGSASRSSADSTLASLSPLTASSKTVASLPRSLCFDASTPPEVAGSETKSKKKKKRSKASIFNSNGGDPSSDIVGNDAINDTSQGNGVSKFTPDESTVSQSLVVFASHLLQLVLAILYFLLSIVTGVFTGDKTATTEKHKGKRKVG
eukprot:CCRYP_001794-RA/>CCRYP_001794-RA protein AED:0.09 eAED:0.09 QI:0/0/0/1/1/1/2/0/608